jgi:hypothetical protein
VVLYHRCVNQARTIIVDIGLLLVLMVPLTAARDGHAGIFVLVG